MSNTKDYCTLDYSDEKIESDICGLIHGNFKSDYVHAVLIRNEQDTFLFSMQLGPGISQAGKYDIAKDNVFMYFVVIDHKKGTIEYGGPITGGTLDIIAYSSGKSVLSGSASNLTGVGNFKGVKFNFNYDLR